MNILGIQIVDLNSHKIDAILDRNENVGKAWESGEKKLSGASSLVGGKTKHPLLSSSLQFRSGVSSFSPFSLTISTSPLRSINSRNPNTLCEPGDRQIIFSGTKCGSFRFSSNMGFQLWLELAFCRSSSRRAWNHAIEPSSKRYWNGEARLVLVAEFEGSWRTWWSRLHKGLDYEIIENYAYREE